MKKSSALGYKSGGGLKILLYIIVFPLVLFIVALFLLLVPLPTPLPPPASSSRNLPVALLTGLSGIIFLAWIGFYSQSRVRKASQSMDTIFLKRGFHLGKAYVYARTFQGMHEGISIHGDLFPDYKLQPWRFNIKASISSDFLAILSNRKPIFHQPNLVQCPTQFQPTSVFMYCNHPEMLKTLLEQNKASQIISRIHKSISTSDTWQISIESQRLHLQIVTYIMCTELMEEWLDIFFHLVRTLKSCRT